MLFAVTTDAGLGCRISNRSSASIATRRSGWTEPHQPIRPSGALRHDRRERRRPAVRSHLPVVVNPRSQFSGDRFGYVERSRATYVFSQLDLGLPRDRAVRFRLGQYGGTSFADPRVLHYTRNSPYVAICLAVHMGARRIGVIGVDFTDHHFFGETGRQSADRTCDRYRCRYRRLNDALSSLGVEIVNLSAASRLTAFPRRLTPGRMSRVRSNVRRPVECVARARPVECAVCVGAPVPAADPIRRRPRIRCELPLPGLRGRLHRRAAARGRHAGHRMERRVVG